MTKAKKVKQAKKMMSSSFSSGGNNSIGKFPPEVIEKLDFYVYRLVDPRNGETFYVGKGKGNRVFNHLAGTLELTDKEKDRAFMSLKQERIHEIHGEQLKVIPIIHRHGMKDEKTAYQVEAALIDAYPGLTNEIGGHGSDCGVMNAKQVIDSYTADEADFRNFRGSLIIKITPDVLNARNGDVYETVRKAWRLKRCLCDKNDVPYVFASLNGIIRGVFKVDRWIPYDKDKPRIYFEGTTVAKLGSFIGKRIPDSYRNKGAAIPTRYIK